jgi:AhpD family alkylhydroperoxidase
MKKRLNYQLAAPDAIGALSQLAENLQTSFPDPKLKALVELRVSQINGCAFCLDMHATQARKLGENQQRLDCLPAWREVAFFNAREKAALAWAESVTLVSETHVPDDVYADASRHFSNQELAQLTIIVALMNMWNRISISFRNTPAPHRGT